MAHEDRINKEVSDIHDIVAVLRAAGGGDEINTMLHLNKLTVHCLCSTLDASQSQHQRPRRTALGFAFGGSSSASTGGHRGGA